MKFIEPLPGSKKKHYQFTAIDDCTRLRVLRVYDRLGQKSAIGFVDYVLEKLPFHVQRIQTDNGSEFQAQFHWHVLDRGIEHVYIRPATPRLNGKVERSHRIDAEEFYRMLDGVVVDDAKVFSLKLQEWEDFYNFDRPHGALGGQTPYERLRQKVRGSSVTGLRQSHSYPHSVRAGLDRGSTSRASAATGAAQPREGRLEAPPCGHRHGPSAGVRRAPAGPCRSRCSRSWTKPRRLSASPDPARADLSDNGSTYRSFAFRDACEAAAIRYPST